MSVPSRLPNKNEIDGKFKSLLECQISFSFQFGKKYHLARLYLLASK